jgi:hypothetical protein
MKGKNFKIPVGFTYSWFNKLKSTEKRDVLLKYLTYDALSILVSQKMNEERVPKTTGIIDSTGLCYLRIGEDLFEFLEEGFVKCMNCERILAEGKTHTKLRNGFIACSNKCYLEIKAKHSKQLYKKTGIKLQEYKNVHREWRKIAPFNQKIPSEITFFYSEGDEFSKGSFKWKISIPDFLDQFYWPLQKKEMTSINLHFQKNDQNYSDSPA